MTTIDEQTVSFGGRRANLPAQRLPQVYPQSYPDPTRQTPAAQPLPPRRSQPVSQPVSQPAYEPTHLAPARPYTPTSFLPVAPEPSSGTQPVSTPPGGLAPGGVPLPDDPAPRPVALLAIGGIATVVIVLGAILAMVFVFGGPHGVDGQAVQQEIVRSTQSAVHVAPTDVRCPAAQPAASGATFTCTATLDTQKISYTVTQTDDQGSFRVTSQRVLVKTDIERTAAVLIGNKVGAPVRVDCQPAGVAVLVNDPGTPVRCTATRVGDPTDRAEVALTIDAANKVAIKLAA